MVRVARVEVRGIGAAGRREWRCFAILRGRAWAVGGGNTAPSGMGAAASSNQRETFLCLEPDRQDIRQVEWQRQGPDGRVERRTWQTGALPALVAVSWRAVRSVELHERGGRCVVLVTLDGAHETYEVVFGDGVRALDVRAVLNMARADDPRG